MSDTAVLEELIVKLTGDVSGLQASFNKAVESSEATAKHIEKHMGGIIGGAVIKAEIALKALEKAFDFVKEATIDMVSEQLVAIDHLAKLSDRTGITTESLAALQIVAEESGLTLDDMAMAAQRLGKQLEAATKGTGPAADALRRLHISLQDIRNLKADEQLALLADAFKGVTSFSEKSAIAVELFGRQGLQMVGMLSKGSEGMEEAKKKAEEFGTALNRVDAAKVEMANDAWRELKDRMEGAARVFTVALAPVLRDVATRLGEWITKAGGVRNIMESVINFCIKIVGGFLDVINNLRISWAFVTAAILAIPAVVEMAFNAVGKKVMQTVKAIELVTAGMLDAVGKKAVALGLKGAASLVEAGGAMREMANGITENSGVLGTYWAKLFDNADKAAKALKNAVPPSQQIHQYYAELKAGAERDASDRIEIYRDLSDKIVDIDAANAQVAALKAEAHVNEEVEQENHRYALLQAMDEDAFKNSTATKDEQNAITEKQAKDHQDRLAKISNSSADRQANWERTTWQQRAGYASSTLGSIATLLEAHGKKSFELGKKVAYAKAIIDVASGAASTIGEFGWYALLGPLEAVLAAGAVQIQQISQMQYGGGGGAPTSGGGGAPSLPEKAQVPGVTGQDSGGQGINVTVVGDVFSANAFRSFAKQIDQALRDGVRITGVRTN